MSVVLAARVPAELAARVHEARGPLSVSEWLGEAAEAYLGSWAVLGAACGSPGLTAAMRELAVSSRESMERLRRAAEAPLPSRCTHRRRGLWCERCCALVAADGSPVRVV